MENSFNKYIRLKVNPFVQTYEYDGLNRLLTATETQAGQSQPNWKQSFSYDRYGNRNFIENQTSEPFVDSSNRNVFNLQIDMSNNRFSLNQGYEYDASGNVTKDATNKRFAYDAENKQISFGTVGSNANGGSYFYDGDGQRVKKIVGTETTIFVYDASGQLVAEYSTTAVENPQVSYLTTDILESPRINTDANGQITARHDYMPFGEEITGLGNRTSGNGYQDDYVRQKFTGYERDNESDLDFAQARYYSSQHGRFTTVDPLIESGRVDYPQSFNRYIYVLNNPVVRIDPTGLDSKEIWEARKEDSKVCLCANPPDATLGKDKNPVSIDPDVAKRVSNPTDFVNLNHGESAQIILPKAIIGRLNQDAAYFYNRGVQEVALYNAAVREINSAVATIRQSPERTAYQLPPGVLNGVGQLINTVPGSTSQSVSIGVFGFGTGQEYALPFTQKYNEYFQQTEIDYETRKEDFINDMLKISSTTTVIGIITHRGANKPNQPPYRSVRQTTRLTKGYLGNLYDKRVGYALRRGRGL